MENLPFCKCGCGNIVSKTKNKFILGHHARVMDLCWNRGLTKETNKSVKKQSNKLKGRTKETHPSIMRQSISMRGRKSNRKGMKHTVESKEKMSNSIKDLRLIPWNKGKTKVTSRRVSLICKKNTGQKRTTEQKLFMSERQKLGWDDNRRKNQSEIKKEQWKDLDSIYNSIEIKKRISISISKTWKDNKVRDDRIKGMTGLKRGKETKKKLRLARIQDIENKKGQACPNYNPEACKLIDEYGKKYNYNFQHAENGGEFFIKDLGYWLDGYDKLKNVAIEVDESFHFDCYGNLKDSDIQRQNEIEKYLDCKFIRIKI